MKFNIYNPWLEKTAIQFATDRMLVPLLISFHVFYRAQSFSVSSFVFLLRRETKGGGVILSKSDGDSTDIRFR